MFVLSIHIVLCKLQKNTESILGIAGELCVYYCGIRATFASNKNHAAQKYYFFSQKCTNENFLKRVGCVFILQNFSSLGDH